MATKMARTVPMAPPEFISGIPVRVKSRIDDKRLFLAVRNSYDDECGHVPPLLAVK